MRTLAALGGEFLFSWVFWVFCLLSFIVCQLLRIVWEKIILLDGRGGEFTEKLGALNRNHCNLSNFDCTVYCKVQGQVLFNLASAYS
jgi:hypothetical protein